MAASRDVDEDWMGKNSGDMGLWPMDFAQSQPLIILQANQMVHDFRDEISYKNGVLPS